MAETSKGVQVSCTIPQEFHKELEDHRWDARLTMTQLVRVALDEYKETHITNADTADDDKPADTNADKPADTKDAEAKTSKK